jgi:hypothetical protein
MRRLLVRVHVPLVQLPVRDLSRVVRLEDGVHVGDHCRDGRALGNLVGDEREQRSRTRRHQVFEEVAHVELVDLGTMCPNELECLHVHVGADRGAGIDVHPAVDVRVPAAQIDLHARIIGFDIDGWGIAPDVLGQRRAC